MTSDDDKGSEPWESGSALVIRSEDGSQASTSDMRFFEPKKPESNVSPVLPFEALTQDLISDVNTYAVEWLGMDSRIEVLPNGTGGGGRKTWMQMAVNANDRADRENRLTFCHYFETIVSLVMAEENPKLLRSYLADAMGICAVWIHKLDRDEKIRLPGIDFPSP